MDERSVEEVGVQHDLRSQIKEYGYKIRHDSRVKILSHCFYQGGFLSTFNFYIRMLYNFNINVVR